MIDTIEKPRLYNTNRPSSYNTLRKQKLLKAIGKCSTMREAGNKAGYSPVSRNIYEKNTKNYIAKNLKVDKEEILRRFNVAYELSLSEKDITNLLRSNEAFARINGMFLDRTKEEGNAPTQIIISYSNTRLAPNVEPGASSQQLQAGEVKQLTDDTPDANVKP